MRKEKIEVKPSVFMDYIVIENEDGSETVMLKSTYDEQQAQQVEHLTESLPTSKP